MSGNVSVANTTGLYIGSGSITVLNSAQSLLNILSNTGTVGFALTNSNTQVLGSVLASGVGAGSYGNAAYYPTFTVGTDGRLTVANVIALSSVVSSYGNANVAAFLPTYTGNVGAGNVISTNVYSSNYFYANGTPFVSGSTYGNANVAAFLPTYTGNLTANNITTSGTLLVNDINGTGSIFYGPVKVASIFGGPTTAVTNGNIFVDYPTNTASLKSNVKITNTGITVIANVSAQPSNITITNGYFVGNGYYLTGITTGSGTYGNANVAAYLASGTDTTVNAINANVTAANAAIVTTNANLGAYQTYANANAASQQTSINSINANVTAANLTISTLSANVGAYETWANAAISSTNANVTAANAAIVTLNANLGAFETYANATFATGGSSNYGNTNVAAYLSSGLVSTNIVTTANVNANNITATSNVNATYMNATTFYGNLIAANVLVANVGITAYTNYNSVGPPAYVAGALWYDNVQDSIAYYNSVTNNEVNVGQELQFNAYNGTASTITQGTPVYLTGGLFGSLANIAPAIANTISTSQVAGVANQNIPAGTKGCVVTIGIVANVSMGSYSVGDTLYLSPYSAGQVQNTQPPTGYVCKIGTVIYNNSPNGIFLVNKTVPVNNQYFGNLTLTGNLTANNASITNGLSAGNITTTSGLYWANGVSYASTVTGTYGNTQVAAYIPTYTGKLGNASNVQIGFGTIGAGSAQTGLSSIVIGSQAGYYGTGTGAIAIGDNSGLGQTGPIASGAYSISIGSSNSGSITANTISIGSFAGGSQGANSIVIGSKAASTNTTYAGSNSIIIGASANGNPSVANTIVLSAGVNSPTPSNSGFYVTPVRNDATSTTQAIYYNTSTNELTYTTAYGNTQVASYLASGTNATINAINANVTAANLTISTLSANVGAFETYANATFLTSATSYGNANVAAYLPTYAGTMQANNYIATANVLASSSRGAFSLGALTQADTGVMASLQTNTNGYAYLGLQNTNAGTLATTDIAFYNDTANLGVYMDVGINSSGYSSTGSLSLPNAGYVYTGNADLSIGTYYNNPIHFVVNNGATDAMTIAANGATLIGNVITTSGVYWANGAAYSSGGGAAFSGNLAGNILYDSVNYRTFANAFPLSTPDATIPGNDFSSYAVYKPVYTSGVLQQPPLANATTGGSGIVSTSSQVITAYESANVALQSGYGFGGQNRNTVGSFFSTVITPVTANTMSNNDRVRAVSVSTQLNLANVTYGTMTSASQNATTISSINAFNNITGNGAVGPAIGGSYGNFITPSATGTANVQYATGIMSFLTFQTTAGTSGLANVVYARGLAPFITGQSANLTVQNAVGLHTYSGWAGSGTVGTTGNPTTGRYAVLNEDANTTIQTSGNITFSGSAGYLVATTANTRLGPFAETVGTFAGTSGTVTVNVGISTIKNYTLTGNITINTNNITNAVAGSSFTLILTQDATGGRTLTSNIKFAQGINNLSTSANATDVLSVFTPDGTIYYGSLVKGYQ